MLQVKIINHDEVKSLLRMNTCIDLLAESFKDLSAGKSLQPLRQGLWHPDKTGLLGMMPAYAAGSDVLGIKIVTVYPGNHAKGLSSHQGGVLLFNGETGALFAIVDGDAVTAIRTAAASAVATDALARPEAKNLTILGSGVQATTHLEAMQCVRPIENVAIWSRSFDKANAFVAHETAKYPELKIIAYEDKDEALFNCDIICTTTASKEPILSSFQLSTGVHINAVGACTPNARELASDVVAVSRLYTDRMESLLKESGAYLCAKVEGLIGESHIKGEIGAVLNGTIDGRTSADDITLFKSLGLAIEDVVVCNHLYELSQTTGEGLDIQL